MMSLFGTLMSLDDGLFYLSQNILCINLI